MASSLGSFEEGFEKLMGGLPFTSDQPGEANGTSVFGDSGPLPLMVTPFKLLLWVGNVMM